MRQKHDLPISVNVRVISPFHEGFIFTKLAKFRENKILAKISEFTVYGALVEGLNLPREKSLAIYFEDSQSRRNRSFNIIVSKLYVDKLSRVH